jgi:hypothetical protein
MTATKMTLAAPSGVGITAYALIDSAQNRLNCYQLPAPPIEAPPSPGSSAAATPTLLLSHSGPSDGIYLSQSNASDLIPILNGLCRNRRAQLMLAG